jgi:LmbE family N-acetylglucosaminyl deacetylase
LRPIDRNVNLLENMIDLKARRWTGLPGNTFRHAIPTAILFLLILCSVLGVFVLGAPRPSGKVLMPTDSPRPSDPLPVDSGATGLQQVLRRLSTTARLMHTTAHPDDEDGSMLTLESRGKGDTVLLLTLNRGEGGQNKVGSNLFDVLGVVRTLELTGSDRYYGVEQRFTRVADFGFSKSAGETFQKWNGHEVALADIVRVIRTFRPDVLVSRFQGSSRDGHGNHQASGVVTREAFRAAADPNKFPEQIKEGLLPWQAKKFYFDNVCPFRSNECAPENYTVKLATGEKDPLLGISYAQFAMEGLKHQLSQGAGGWSIDAGPHYSFYRLVDSVLPPTAGKDGHEQDFFDGIDTTLPGLASRLGSDEAKVTWLRPELVKLQGDAEAAKKAGDPASAATPLLDGLQAVSALITRVLGEMQIAEIERRELLGHLREKQQQFEQAANLALGISVSATVDSPVAPTPEDAFMAVPGQTFGVTAVLRNAGKKTISLQEFTLNLPGGWKMAATSSKITAVAPGQSATVTFRVTVPENAAYTRPYWHRNDPETEALNTIDDERFATLPFPPATFRARVNYSDDGHKGTAQSAIQVPFKDSDGHEQLRTLAVAPALSVAIDPTSQVVPLGQHGARTVKVSVRSQINGQAAINVKLAAPQGWQVDPAVQHVTLDKPGESKECEFKVMPSATREGKYALKATAEYQSKAYSEGYTVVTRDDLDTFYYYQPAVQRVSVVEVTVPANLKVGYIMGAGDEIPTVLGQLGIDVRLLPVEKLASADLSQYKTIVVGIRAYDTQKELVDNNRKLLDFVRARGTLLVQYETDIGNFNGGQFTPYPASLGRGRVSVEEAAVNILAPKDPVFHTPNEITARDFEGWVQERGLYFMDTWDDKYTPLLGSRDPGEDELKGGLLRASYGKGTYIYDGYAFFRQLPAGVPGAVRLYVNLLAAGQ